VGLGWVSFHVAVDTELVYWVGYGTVMSVVVKVCFVEEYPFSFDDKAIAYGFIGVLIAVDSYHGESNLLFGFVMVCGFDPLYG